VAENPNTILNNLNDFRKDKVAGTYIRNASAQSESNNLKFTFEKDYHNQQSSQSAYAESAQSFGLSGSFGPYSGSCQANHKQERESASEEINGILTAYADSGTVAFKGDHNKIRQSLDTGVLEKLDNINSFESAEAFTKEYGTHLVTSVRLGGLLTLVVKIMSRSLSEKQELAVQAEAAYSGVGSMEATASASQKVATMSSTKSMNVHLRVIGGSPETATAANMDHPDTIAAWAKTCDENSVSGLHEALELYKLAAGAQARDTLKAYLDLCLLKHSVENPVIFSNMVPINKTRYNSVSVPVDGGYKIISGGAWLAEYGSDFLTGSYPDFSGGVINSWQAASHDCMEESTDRSELVGYAIGVHDPTDLLSVYCGSANGSNHDWGGDTATKTLEGGYVLTGGGCQLNTDQPMARYLTGSYPTCVNGDTYNGWVADGRDYVNPSVAQLKAWAIGIRLKNASDYLTLSHRVIKKEGGNDSHGTSLAVLGGQAGLAGGGVQLSDNGENLVHASFPATQSNQMGWQEYNGDLYARFHPVVATAYAITLEFTGKKGVTFQPYGR